MFEVFLVSIIYWTTLLVVFVWLNRRLSALRERIVDLEGKIKGGYRGDEN